MGTNTWHTKMQERNVASEATMYLAVGGSVRSSGFPLPEESSATCTKLLTPKTESTGMQSIYRQGASLDADDFFGRGGGGIRNLATKV